MDNTNDARAIAAGLQAIAAALNRLADAHTRLVDISNATLELSKKQVDANLNALTRLTGGSHLLRNVANLNPR